MVVTERLTKVADKLSKVADDNKSAIEQSEEADSLEASPLDTPIPTPPSDSPPKPLSPKSLSPKTKSPPSEMVAPVTPMETEDQLGDRVHQIFGKRRAIDIVGPISDPKVANMDTTEGAVGVTEDSQVNSESTTQNQNNSTSDEMEVGDGDETDDEGANEDDTDGIDVHGGTGDEDGWNGQEEEPEAFPEAGFPMQVPGYPIQPVFNYRYRTPNSTPRSRRVDFENAIVLPDVRRDPHTNRISQEDYEAREDAEMALSLGLVNKRRTPYHFLTF